MVRRIFSSWLDLVLLFVPVTVALELLKADPLLIFITSGLVIVPLAGLLGRATEHITTHVGAGVGSLLNASLGNAAEHSTAVLMAMKNKMDLALGIAVGSSMQIALLVAPLLVFASYLFGAPLDLIFTPFEVAAVTMSVLILGFVSMDGESHWMEGVMLVGVYAMLAIAFYFLPA